MRMRKKKNIIILLLLCEALLTITSAAAETETTTDNNDIKQENKKEDPKKLFSKSYIEKFSNSWHVFAKANDIAKREKLKKALTDALDSIDTKRKSEIVENINTKTVQRIKHAASLLKEFKQMYTLSENVKKTLQSYNEAKKNLSVSIKTDSGMDILKRFLVHRPNRKRDEIPTNQKDGTVFDKNVISNPDDDDSVPMVEPQYITKTSKLSLKAALDKTGHIALEYASVNPSTSSIHKAEKAFKAAQVLLAYAQKGEKTKIPVLASGESSHGEKPVERDRLKQKQTSGESHEVKNIEPITDQSHHQLGLSAVTHKANITGHTNAEESKEHTLEALIQDEDTYLPAAKKTVEGKTSDRPDDSASQVVKEVEKNQEKHAVNFTRVKSGEKRTNPYVELLKKIYRSKNITLSQNDGEKKDTTKIKSTESKENTTYTIYGNEIENKDHGKTTEDKDDNTEKQKNEENITKDINDIDKSLTQNKEENQNITTTAKSVVETKNETLTTASSSEKENSKNNTTTTPNQDETTKIKESEIDTKTNTGTEETKSSSEIKSLDTTVTLKKQEDAVQRLQEAKAARQKYEIAKHELAEKVKQLYDMANEYEKQETADQILEEKNKIGGMNLTDEELLERNFLNSKRDDSHPGIALTSIAHHKMKEISTAESESDLHRGFTMGVKDKNEHQIELDSLKTSDGSGVKKVYDVGLPKTLKLDDIGSSTAKKSSKSQEETLKVIAEAIQEDMADIAENEKQKKKLLLSTEKSDGTPLATAVNQNGEKKATSSDKIDEYLTKALAEIMGNDTTNGPTPTKTSSESTPDPTATKTEEDKSNDADKNRKIVEKAMANHAKHPDLPLPLVETKGDKVVLNKGEDKEKEKDKPTKPQKSNDIFAHATDRASSTSNEKSPTLDMKDPENKALLDKASHMEEQVAAAQDKLYQNELKDPEPNLPQAAAEGSHYSPIQPPQLPPPAVPPMAYSSRHMGGGDPYGSIDPSPQAPPHFSKEQQDEREEEPDDREREEEEEEVEDEEDRYPLHRRHHHPHHHRRHYLQEEDLEDAEEEDDRDDDSEDDDDEDDRDEDDDKKSRVGYHNEQAKKRTLLPGVTNTRIKTKAAIITEPTAVVKKSELNGKASRSNNKGNQSFDEERHIEELEDSMSKKSFVPKRPRVYYKRY